MIVFSWNLDIFCYGLRLWILFKVCFLFHQRKKGNVDTLLPDRDRSAGSALGLYWQPKNKVPCYNLDMQVWAPHVEFTGLVVGWPHHCCVRVLSLCRVCYDTHGEGCLVTAVWVWKSKLWSPLTLGGSLPDNGDEDPTSLLDHLWHHLREIVRAFHCSLSRM